MYLKKDRLYIGEKIEFRWDFVQGMLKELSYQVSDLVSNKEL